MYDGLPRPSIVGLGRRIYITYTQRMPQTPFEFDLCCPSCGWATVCASPKMTDWLSRHRLIKKSSDLQSDLLAELFRASAEKFACPQCGKVGLAASRSEPLADEAWGQARMCEFCGTAIPAERLEAFPDATLCVACQSRDERGELTGPAEYCSRCGSILKLSQSRGAGITRYVMICCACGRAV